MSVTLQVAVHLGRDCSLNFRQSKSVEQLFRTTEKVITEQTEITEMSTINRYLLIWRESSLLCERAVRMLKSKTYVFFLTRCCVWEASVQNQFKPGKTKLSGIWKHAISKNWIELMENRWSSSDNFSQDSLHWEFSLRFKR